MGTQKNISISLVHSQFAENPRWRTQIFIRSLGFVRMMTRSLVSGPGPWPWALALGPQRNTIQSSSPKKVWLLGSRICSYTISGSGSFSDLFRYHELGQLRVDVRLMPKDDFHSDRAGSVNPTQDAADSVVCGSSDGSLCDFGVRWTFPHPKNDEAKETRKKLMM